MGITRRVGNILGITGRPRRPPPPQAKACAYYADYGPTVLVGAGFSLRGWGGVEPVPQTNTHPPSPVPIGRTTPSLWQSHKHILQLVAYSPFEWVTLPVRCQTLPAGVVQHISYVGRKIIAGAKHVIVEILLPRDTARVF